MRCFAILILTVWAGLAGAQEFSGEAGACVMEDSGGGLLNAGTCLKMPAQCNPQTCDVAFFWQRDDYETVITLPGAMAPVAEGIAMNGQEAYAPAGLRDSDPRDCVFNAVSGAVFCWMPGIEPFNLAAGADINLVNANLRTYAGVDTGAVRAHAEPGEEEGDMVGIYESLQGKYRPLPSWDCGEIGRDGGALAIQGTTFYGLETECDLQDPQAVGVHGTAIFTAICRGEGETWEDEYILRRDEWGSLAVISADGVAVWEACE